MANSRYVRAAPPIRLGRVVSTDTGASAYLNCGGVTTVGRSSAGIDFFRDFAVDRADRASKESEPPPLLWMKRSNALTRGIIKRSMGTIALIQRSGTGKSGSGTSREPLRISGSAT